jgi:branched-chain amino acid transport system substrate-binding protein
MKHLKKGLLMAGMVAGAATMAASSVQAKDLVVGMACDRTGPTQTVGVMLCPGYHDYVKLINSKGGIMGNKVKVLEIDTQYKVPASVEAYQRFKKEGALVVALWGTPMTQAITPNLNADHIPGTSPGFGTAAAANGIKYPYLFPMAASYWSQAGAAVTFAKAELGGEIKGKKIAFIYYDNPAGREPIPVLEKLAKMEGFELKKFAIPPPGVEMKVQVQDITRRYRADFVISHLFGKGPAVHIKAFKRMGYPLKKLLSFVWGAGEADINGAGGWAKAQGYNALNFAGVGSDYPILDEIKAMYKAEGKEPPKQMASTVYYNRGIFAAAVHLKAMEMAIKAKGSADITGEDVQKGFLAIKDFKLGGILPPLNFTNLDHEGGGWARVFRVEGDNFVPAGDWIRGYRDVVMQMLKEDH